MTSHPPEPPAQWPPPSPEEGQAVGSARTPEEWPAGRGSVPEPRRSGRQAVRSAPDPGGVGRPGRESAVPGGPARQRPPGGSRLPGQRGAPAAGGLPAGERLPAMRPAIQPEAGPGPGGPGLPGPARLPPGHLLPAGHLLLGLPVDARLSAHAGLPGRGRATSRPVIQPTDTRPVLTRPMATRPRRTPGRPSRRADPRWWSSRRPTAAGRWRPPRSLTRSTSTPAAWPPPARTRSGHPRAPAQPRPLRCPMRRAHRTPAGPCSATSRCRSSASWCRWPST